MRILREEIIPAKEYLGLDLDEGQILRIVDVEGKQVADVVCFNRQRTGERSSASNSKEIQSRWWLTTGHALYSDEGNKMLTIVEDTVGVNYVGGWYCNEESNYRRYGVHGTRNCRDNLVRAAARLGVGPKEMPGAFAPFMNVIHHPDGRFQIAEPTSGPGDHIDLRAEMDLFVAISNCPQENNPCNGFKPTPLGVLVYEPN
jgi:urea carboxylase-associated protein 1